MILGYPGRSGQGHLHDISHPKGRTQLKTAQGRDIKAQRVHYQDIIFMLLMFLLITGLGDVSITLVSLFQGEKAQTQLDHDESGKLYVVQLQFW